MRLPHLVTLAIVSLCALPSLGCTASDGHDPVDLPPCDIAPPPADWTYPLGPYGKKVGERFADFELNDCDGKSVRFGDILGDASVVLFNVGAGWCKPCLDEAEILESQVYRPHCASGLRVVQVLKSDDDDGPATTTFCSKWRDRWGMTFPVLIDPLFETSRYVDASGFPLNMLVDHTGVIRYVHTGDVPSDLNQRIGELLAP